MQDQWDDENAPLISGGTPSCGNRTDLPRKQRRHQYVVLARDVRNGGSAGFVEGTVSACDVCGRDKFERSDELPPAPW